MSFRVTFTAKYNERKQERFVLSVKTNIEPKRRRYTNENEQRTFSNEFIYIMKRIYFIYAQIKLRMKRTCPPDYSTELLYYFSYGIIF